MITYRWVGLKYVQLCSIAGSSSTYIVRGEAELLALVGLDLVRPAW